MYKDLIEYALANGFEEDGTLYRKGNIELYEGSDNYVIYFRHCEKSERIEFLIPKNISVNKQIDLLNLCL